jgi:ERCC4-type nuclease
MPKISEGERIKIIIDTREQKPLIFTDHETVTRKLDEGDYNIVELEDKIVIERKSIQDLYGSIIQGHARFKREILRAKAKNKKFYIFLEGTKTAFIRRSIIKYNIKWETLSKIINTMVTRYDLIIVECEDRELMSSKIIETIENELKNGVGNNG